MILRRTACYCSVITSCLLTSPVVLAQSDELTLEDVLSQEFMGIPFNKGAPYMIEKLNKVGFKVVDQDDSSYTLKRDEIMGPIILEIRTRESDKVYHVLRYAPRNLYEHLEDATKALQEKCANFAKDNAHRYEISAPLELSEGEDVALGMDQGKEYFCGFDKKATDEDYKKYELALQQVEKNLSTSSKLPQNLRDLVDTRLHQHGYGYSLHGHEGAYMVIEETLDFYH